MSELQTNLSLAEPTRPERGMSRPEEDAMQQTYSAVARKSKGPAPSPGVTKAAPPQPPSATATPTQPAKSSGSGFYSFLKRSVKINISWK